MQKSNFSLVYDERHKPSDVLQAYLNNRLGYVFKEHFGSRHVSIGKRYVSVYLPPTFYDSVFLPIVDEFIRNYIPNEFIIRVNKSMYSYFVLEIVRNEE